MQAAHDKHNDEENYVMNMRLLKSTGFYQLIDPDTRMLYRFNPYQAIANFEVAYGYASVAMLLTSAFHSRRNTFDLMNSLMLAVAIFFSTFKIHSVIRNKEIVWNSLDMTSIAFLSYRHHDRNILRSARSLSVTTSTIFVVLWSVVAVAWIMSPIFVKNVYLEVDFDGAVRRYRYNSLNFVVYPITEQFYNEHFFAFYLVEVLQVLFWGHGILTYDAFVVSICITISNQLKTIGDSYSRLCTRLEDAKDIESDALSHLKHIIRDHQRMIKSMREIYKLLQPVTFVQLATESMLIILQAFMIFINFYNGLTITSVSNIKLFLTIIPNITHLFTTCYLFSIINEQKELMNFALYRSDWTTMSVNYKKIMLLAMRMNDAENLKLKITSRKIINLELFASVMHTTYSIISVLSKSYRNTSKTPDVHLMTTEHL